MKPDIIYKLYFTPC